MSDLKEKERSAIKTLESLGYEVKLSKATTKKTFEVEIETLSEFVRLQIKSGKKMKEAIQEALHDWVRKNS